jgi:hypothetical protein
MFGDDRRRQTRLELFDLQAACWGFRGWRSLLPVEKSVAAGT